MSLGKNISFVFIINIISYLLTPLSMTFITKSLSAEKYGVYGFLALVSTFANVFCSLGLDMYNFRKIPGKEPEEQYTVFKSILSVQILATIVSLVIIFLFLKDQLFLYGIAAFYLISLFINIINVEIQRFFGLKKRIIIKTLLAFLHARGPLLIIAFYFFFSLSGVTIRVLYFSIFLANILLLITSILIINKRLFIQASIQKNIVREGLLNSLPLLVINMGSYLLDMGDRYLIKFFLDDRDLGLYSYGYNWMRMIFTIGLVIVGIIRPYIAEVFNKDKLNSSKENFEYLLVKSYKYAFYIMFFGVTFFVINFNEIVLFLSKPEYVESRSVTLILALFPFFMLFSEGLHFIAVLLNETKRIAAYYLFAAFFNIVLNMILIPILGVQGAAITTILSYLVLDLIFYRLIRKSITFHSVSRKNIFNNLIFVIIFIAINCIFYFINIHILIKGVLVIAIALPSMFVTKVLTVSELRKFMSYK